MDIALQRINDSYEWSLSDDPDRVNASKELRLDGLGLNELPSLLKKCVHLEVLHCDKNNLTSLPKELVNLKELYCNNNQIYYLPAEYTKLEQLYCQFNNLCSIPNYPNLSKLYSYGNNIMRKVLAVSGNQGIQNTNLNKFVERHILKQKEAMNNYALLDKYKIKPNCIIWTIHFDLIRRHKPSLLDPKTNFDDTDINYYIEQYGFKPIDLMKEIKGLNNPLANLAISACYVETNKPYVLEDDSTKSTKKKVLKPILYTYLFAILASSLYIILH